MSTKREPLLSNEALEFLMANHTPEQIRDILALYEWTRAKDAELIQMLIEAGEQVISFCGEPTMRDKAEFDRGVEMFRAARSAYESAGFKPTEQ